MKRKLLIIFTLILAPISIIGQENGTDAQKELNALAGLWQIDLRPTPESEAYYQSFLIEDIKERSFTGTFYGSEITNGFINTNWSKIYFAFSTSDQSNIYYHSGYVENDTLYGITYCPNRSLTAPWTGTRDKQ